MSLQRTIYISPLQSDTEQLHDNTKTSPSTFKTCATMDYNKRETKTHTSKRIN